ncbi:MAG: hypothetical protein M1815_001242 [Lichina confinis]|nr:MAG: hypothetical protein M1815_001242 [Lichina confinis]
MRFARLITLAFICVAGAAAAEQPLKRTPYYQYLDCLYRYLQTPEEQRSLPYHRHELFCYEQYRGQEYPTGDSERLGARRDELFNDEEWRLLDGTTTDEVLGAMEALSKSEPGRSGPWKWELPNQLRMPSRREVENFGRSTWGTIKKFILPESPTPSGPSRVVRPRPRPMPQ